MGTFPQAGMLQVRKITLKSLHEGSAPVERIAGPSSPKALECSPKFQGDSIPRTQLPSLPCPHSWLHLESSQGLRWQFWDGSRDTEFSRGNLHPAVTTPGVLVSPRVFGIVPPPLSPFLAGFPCFGSISQIFSTPPGTRICSDTSWASPEGVRGGQTPPQRAPHTHKWFPEPRHGIPWASSSRQKFPQDTGTSPTALIRVDESHSTPWSAFALILRASPHKTTLGESKKTKNLFIHIQKAICTEVYRCFSISKCFQQEKARARVCHSSQSRQHCLHQEPS